MLELKKIIKLKVLRILLIIRIETKNRLKLILKIKMMKLICDIFYLIYFILNNSNS